MIMSFKKSLSFLEPNQGADAPRSPVVLEVFTSSASVPSTDRAW
jgi:hypothetical protein